MFCAGVAAVIRLLTRNTVEGGESRSSVSADSDQSETQETSSAQRECSDYINRASLEEWSSAESLLLDSSFSEAMSGSVTVDQQRREEQNAMALSSPVSEELIRNGQWIQDTRGELASPQRAGFWPHFNRTATDVTPRRAGCSKSPKNNYSLASEDTDAILERMTYVGGMNYAKYRLEALQHCVFKMNLLEKMRRHTVTVPYPLLRHEDLRRTEP